MKEVRKLAGETVLYGFGTFVPRMMNFLLVPLHTKIFHPEQFGVITELYAYVGVLNVIYTFGMETAYFRFANKADQDGTRIFNIAQTFVVGLSLVFTILFVSFSGPLSQMLELPDGERYIRWLALIMFIDAVVALPFARLRLEGKALLFTVAKISNITLLIGLNLLFLLVFYDPSVGVAYVILANLIANAFYLFFFSRQLFAWRPSLDNAVFSGMFAYAFPIMVTGLAGMTNEMFSRITLEHWLPPDFYPGKSSEYALGVFGACYKYAIFMNLAIQAFRFAAEPFFFSKASDKKSPQLFASVNHYFVVVCCILLFGVGINLDVLKYLLGSPEYWEGLVIVPVLLTAYLFLGVYYNFSVWFKLTDRTSYGTFFTVGGVIVTIALNYVLIPVAGYFGSSLVTLACYLFMTIACYFYGQKYYPIPYRVAQDSIYIMATLVLVYGVPLLSIEPQWLATVFHLFLLAMYVLFVLLIERRNFRRSTEQSIHHSG